MTRLFPDERGWRVYPGTPAAPPLRESPGAAQPTLIMKAGNDVPVLLLSPVYSRNDVFLLLPWRQHGAHVAAEPGDSAAAPGHRCCPGARIAALGLLPHVMPPGRAPGGTGTGAG